MSSDYQKEIVKRLDLLAGKIDMLTKVCAISSNIQGAFEGKTKKEQIKILYELELPRNIIALMVGTTPDTVSARLSEMKAEEEKNKSRKEEESKEH